MARKDPVKVAQKWSERLGMSQAEMEAGIAALTEAPSQGAIRMKEKMRMKLLEALNSGKWEEALQAFTLTAYQQAMRTKGIPHAIEGATTGKPKMQAFLSEFLPFAEQVSQEVQAMPAATEADMRARMMANFDRMKTFKRTRRG